MVNAVMIQLTNYYPVVDGAAMDGRSATVPKKLPSITGHLAPNLIKHTELSILLDFAKLFFGDNFKFLTSDLRTAFGELSNDLFQSVYDIRYFKL